MIAHRVGATVARDGTLTLRGLPFPAGEQVEVIVLPVGPTLASEGTDPQLLQGSVLHYDDPFEPVADEYWEALG